MKTLSNQLNYINAVATLRAAIGGISFLKELYSVSQREWDNAFNMADESHFIRDVMVSAPKTDLIKQYVAKLVKVHMNSVSLTVNAWTKIGMDNQNDLSLAIINSLAVSKHVDNLGLFKLVAAQLLGFDPLLVEAAVAENGGVAAEALVKYLAYRNDELEQVEIIYAQLIENLAAAMTEKTLTEDFFIALVRGAERLEGYSSPVEALEVAFSY